MRFLLVVLSGLTICGLTFNEVECAQPLTPAELAHSVPKVEGTIHVDGVLDEDFWNDALVLRVNVEVRPAENKRAPVDTDAYLAYTETHLYAAFKCYDPDPSQIRARYTDRDQLWTDDWIALNLDTFNDQRRSFLFFSNPYGVQADNIENEGSNSTAWDAIWESAGEINDEGWFVEMAIPFSSMRFQRTSQNQIWGIDVIRSYPRSVRHHIGLFPRDRNNNCYLCQAEKIEGFAGVTPGKNIEIDPTFSSYLSMEREDETSGPFRESEREYDPGLTAKWGLTPNLTLTTTVNPDFSQVEADARQFEANRNFAIYYSERRPFFLEGSSFFQSRLNMVHTRTLADPDWGIKLTGKEQGIGIGFFMAEDNVTNLLFPSSSGSDSETLNKKSIASVLRLRRDIGQSSTAGITATHREAGLYANSLISVDGDIRFNQKNLIRFQLAGTNTTYPDDIVEEYEQPENTLKGYATHLTYVYNTRTLDTWLAYNERNKDFRADVGFLTQVDIRSMMYGMDYTWTNDNDHWWTQLVFGGDLEYSEELDGTLLEKEITFWLNYWGQKESFINSMVEYGTDGYEGEKYEKWQAAAFSEFNPLGNFYLNLWTSAQKTIDYTNEQSAHRINIEPGGEYRPGPHWTIGLNYDYERLFINSGKLYDANSIRLRLIYQFNRRMFIRAIFQNVDYRYDVSKYDEDDEKEPEDRSLFSQLLFSYKINPQTVLYLGYTDDYFGDQVVGLRQTNYTIFMKIGYAWVL